MSERNYYVMCDNNCKFPAMTKEQILAAIAEATGQTLQDVDGAFITKIKEQNAGGYVTFWRGTQAQYNALATKDENCFYIISDSTEKEDTASAIAELAETVEKKVEPVSGSWSPKWVTMAGEEIACTANTFVGGYYKIGKLVYINIWFSGTITESGQRGCLTLPFKVSNSAYSRLHTFSIGNDTVHTERACCAVIYPAAGNQIRIGDSTSAVAVLGTSAGLFELSGCYITDE